MRVAGGRNQAEAELIQGMLLEEGVPSMLRRSAGLRRARLPRRRARATCWCPSPAPRSRASCCTCAGLAPPAGHGQRRPNPLVLFAVILGGGGLVALVAWLLQGR